ncbi:MAG: FtsW/RodA/SpoVE family cell cycle protein [Caldimicrobium sp.]
MSGTTRFKEFIKENMWVFLVLFCLILINIINQLSMGETSGYFWKNVLWHLIGLVLFCLFVIFFDYRKVPLGFVWIVYFLIVFLLMVLALFKKRWLVIGALSIQPTEFLKIILLYLLSLYINKKKELKLENSETIFLLGVILLPLIFILPVDLDYAFIIGTIFFSFLLFFGFPKRLLVGLVIFSLTLFIILTPIMWNKLKPHQKGRIYGYLDPEKYYKTWGYQLSQSLIAIGSGGIKGQGLKKGWSTRLGYLPAKNTDLAFSVFAEAFGLFGTTIFLILYGYLLYWGLMISMKAKDLLGKALSLGIVLIFMWQAFFNIGGASGLLPMTSIPQPFLSYGGSITIATYLFLSILFNIAFKKVFFK